MIVGGVSRFYGGYINEREVDAHLAGDIFRQVSNLIMDVLEEGKRCPSSNFHYRCIVDPIKF